MPNKIRYIVKVIDPETGSWCPWSGELDSKLTLHGAIVFSTNRWRREVDSRNLQLGIFQTTTSGKSLGQCLKLIDSETLQLPR